MMNNKGFSLPEILIGVGIMGAVALGSIQLFKSQNDVKKSVDRNNDIQMIQKLVESKLYTEEGCHSVKGLSVGSSISLQIGPNTYSNGSKIGTDQINNFKIAEFIPYDEAGLSGVAKINLSIRSQNGKDTIIQLPLAVNMNGSSIESCNTSLQRITDDLFQNICGGSFGTLSSGKTCSQVLAELQSIISKSICDDVFGSNGQMSGANCNLDIIHANKLCGADSAAVGYDRQGKITCKPVKNSTATPPAVKVCSSWSGWSPAASGACTTATVTQTRSCTSGATETQTQTVSGTKACSTNCTNWGDWGPNTDGTCTTATVTQTRSCTTGSETQTRAVSGTKNCDGKDCIVDHPMIWSTKLVGPKFPKGGNCTCMEYQNSSSAGNRTSKLKNGESVTLQGTYCQASVVMEGVGGSGVLGQGSATVTCDNGLVRLSNETCGVNGIE